MKDYRKITTPLTLLLKTDGFQWGAEFELAVVVLKKAMEEVSMLALPNFSDEFMIEADTLGIGVGAILTQRGRPIAFFNQALSDHARRKLVYKREVMAVVLVV